MRSENYFHPRVRDQSIGELVNVSKKSVKLVKRALIHAGLHRRKSTSNQILFPEIHVFAFPFNYISKSYPPPKTLKYSYHETLK